MTRCNCDEFNTDVTFSGNIELGGAIAKIGGRTHVGITANPLDDLIHDFDGTAYWFSGTQGGTSHGSAGTEAMKLNDNAEQRGPIPTITDIGTIWEVRRWLAHSQPLQPSDIICLIDYDLSLPIEQELAHEGREPESTEDYRDAIPAHRPPPAG